MRGPSKIAGARIHLVAVYVINSATIRRWHLQKRLGHEKMKLDVFLGYPDNWVSSTPCGYDDCSLHFAAPQQSISIHPNPTHLLPHDLPDSLATHMLQITTVRRSISRRSSSPSSPPRPSSTSGRSLRAPTSTGAHALKRKAPIPTHAPSTCSHPRSCFRALRRWFWYWRCAVGLLKPPTWCLATSPCPHPLRIPGRWTTRSVFGVGPSIRSLHQSWQVCNCNSNRYTPHYTGLIPAAANTRLSLLCAVGMAITLGIREQYAVRGSAQTPALACTAHRSPSCVRSWRASSCSRGRRRPTDF